jgi:hypothetical protein
MAPSSDPRFARLQTDPRFRRPKQKSLKVELDERFRDVLESEEFGGKGKGKGKSKLDQGTPFCVIERSLLMRYIQGRLISVDDHSLRVTMQIS